MNKIVFIIGVLFIVANAVMQGKTTTKTDSFYGCTTDYDCEMQTIYEMEQGNE